MLLLNLYDSRPTAPTFLVFFQGKRTLQESGHVPQVHFHCVFSGTMCLGFDKSAWIHMWCCQPLPDLVSFPKGKRASEESPGNLEERHMLTKEFSHVCVERKKSDAAASTWAKDPQAPKRNQLPREDMWKRRVVKKHHQYSCCGQKHVFTYVVGGRVGMNETCYFTFDMKNLDLCSLLIYTPSSHRHRPRRNRCVFSCKMRLAFISTVNLHVTLANPGEIVVFFNEKCALYQPPQIPCVFSGKMRLAFLVPVNSYDTRPTALGFRIFFHLKRASRKPFQIPCVFSSKTRLALNVIAKFIWLAADRSHIPGFFQRKRTLQESGHVPQVHFHCVFSGTMCLGFTSQCEFTCDAASPCRILFLFPRESPGSLEERHMLTKEFSHVCVERKKSDAAASTWAKDPQAPTRNQLPRKGYVDTAGSEETSSVFMLWAKTCVYICSGRAGGNERDLLFYVRYEEPCHPTPPHPPNPPHPCIQVMCSASVCASARYVIIPPHPTHPTHPTHEYKWCVRLVCVQVQGTWSSHPSPPQIDPKGCVCF